MSIIDNKIVDVEQKTLQLEAEVKALEVEKVKLITEKEETENKTRKPEQDELVSLRENIKSIVDTFNSKAVAYGIDVGVGLLTTGGHNIYEINEDGESENGEYFSDSEYENYYTKYGRSKNFWFPSSLNC